MVVNIWNFKRDHGDSFPILQVWKMMFTTHWNSNKLIFWSLGCLMLKCPPAILIAFPCSWKGPSRIHLISSFWSVMCHFIILVCTSFFYCLRQQECWTVGCSGLLRLWPNLMLEVHTVRVGVCNNHQLQMASPRKFLMQARW